MDGTVGEKYEYDVEAYDADGDELIYSLMGYPYFLFF